MKKLALLAFLVVGVISMSADTAEARTYKIKGEVRAQTGGYRHVVIIKNKSRDWLTCEVWTDVDVMPHHSARLGPRTSREVIIRTKAVEDTFIPYGFCRNNY